MAIKNLLVRGGADFSGMQKEMAKVQKSLANFQSSVGGTMKKIGGLLGGLAIGKLVKDSTQMAMSVESSIGNINRNMGSSAKKFQEWVNTQSQGFGIAQADAYKYGGTFSNLLSSFSKSTEETGSKTTELMKATAIIASKTGRSYEDTAERIRSGMLGSTEAIEDLGVYTNISMIESTEAFKKFANGKSWAQLDFQTQQQIRLAAILEQTYARYGNELANTTQTAHMQFISSLKNIKLSLGQAFMPIYSFILPALTAMANAIGTVFNYIAQFTTALFGKANNTQKQAQATMQQAQATTSLGKATENAGKKAKKAGKEATKALASFDEINSISKPKSESGDDALGGGLGEVGAVGVPPLEMGGFADSTIKVSEKVQAMADKIKKIFADLSGFISKNKNIIISSLGGILAAIGSFQVISNWSKIIGVFKLALASIGTVFASISWPIVAVAAVIGLLVGNIIYLWQTNEGFRDSVLAVWQQIKDFVTTVVSDMWTIIKEIWDTYGATLIQNVKDFMASIQEIIVNVWENILKPIIEGALKMLKWLWDSHFRDMIKQLLEFIMKCVNGALELWNKFISPIVNWLIKTLGPAFSKVFTYIVNIMGSALAHIADVASGILKVLGGIIDFIVGVFTGNWKKAWEGVRNIFKGVFDSLFGIVKYPLNLIIDAINFVLRGLNKLSIKIPKWVPKFGGETWGVNIPTIPKLAKGGIVDNPTLAIVGEAGKEAVMPLENNTGWITDIAGKVADRMPRGSNNSSGNGDLTVELYMDSNKMGDVIVKSFRKLEKKTGKVLLPI